MSLNVTIPEIAITPDAEEDDDHSFLNLAESLTDVEDLDDENSESKKPRIRTKLKIKVNESDGYATGLEDVEASDDEEITIIKQHSSPIVLDDLDMEQYAVDENYGVSEKKSDNFEFKNFQSSMTNDTLRPIQTNESGNTPVPTDVEDYDTESDPEESNIPDVEIPFDFADSFETVKISDEMQNKNSSPAPIEAATPHTSTAFPITLFEEANFKKPIRRPPTFSQIMRAKAKAEENRARKKKRCRNSRKRTEPKEDETDSSETETNDSNRKKKNLMSMNSLNYESDGGEENKLPFPVCKKTFTKKKVLLQAPEGEHRDLTDFEDVECDVDVSIRRKSIDNTFFQEQLDEMASCYSFSKDKDEEKLNDSGKTEEPPKTKKLSRRMPEKKPDRTNLSLAIPKDEQTGHTDVENLDSPDSGNDESEENQNPERASFDTIEHCFKDSIPTEITDSPSDEPPDISLPPPTRSLIISEENNSLIPTVKILPLDEVMKTDSEAEKVSTEDEDFNSDKEISEIRNTHSPQLPLIEDEAINDSETCFYLNQKSLNIEEVATDIEELDEVKKKKKKPKKTNTKFLIPDNVPVNQLTDVEDLDMSDNKSSISMLSVPNLEIGGHTDVEELTSDDESKNLQKLPEPEESGMDNAEEVEASADVDLALELETPNELNNELEQASSTEVNIENSAKIDYSAPEEVMYLKGGGFQEIPTDVEELFEDAESQFHNAMEAWEYFNTGEGESSSKPSGPHDTSSLRDQSRESSADKHEGTSKPIDQHQLSDEMKELLKEMEKTSHQ